MYFINLIFKEVNVLHSDSSVCACWVFYNLKCMENYFKMFFVNLVSVKLKFSLNIFFYYSVLNCLFSLFCKYYKGLICLIYINLVLVT